MRKTTPHRRQSKEERPGGLDILSTRFPSSARVRLCRRFLFVRRPGAGTTTTALALGFTYCPIPRPEIGGPMCDRAGCCNPGGPAVAATKKPAPPQVRERVKKYACERCAGPQGRGKPPRHKGGALCFNVGASVTCGGIRPATPLPGGSLPGNGANLQYHVRLSIFISKGERGAGERGECVPPLLA